MNGAGKSTTLKMIVGLLAPTLGTINLDGANPLKDRRQLSRRIGYMAPLKGHLWWDLPAHDSFTLIAAMYGLPRSQWASDLEHLSSELDFDQGATKPVRQLSTGNRVKAELISTLLPRPEFLVLDEPTLGLDLLAKDAIHRLLREFRNQRGTTVMITSHDLTDVENLCDDLVVLDAGQAIFQGSRQMLTKYASGRRVLRIDFDQHSAAAQFAALWHVDHLVGQSIEVSFTADRAPADLIAAAFSHTSVQDVRVDSEDFEDLVRRLYQMNRTGPTRADQQF